MAQFYIRRIRHPSKAKPGRAAQRAPMPIQGVLLEEQIRDSETHGWGDGGGVVPEVDYGALVDWLSFCGSPPAEHNAELELKPGLNKHPNGTEASAARRRSVRAPSA